MRMRIVSSVEIRPRVFFYTVMVYPSFWRRWLGATIETEQYFITGNNVSYQTGGKLDARRIKALSRAMNEDIAAEHERKKFNANDMR